MVPIRTVTLLQELAGIRARRRVRAVLLPKHWLPEWSRHVLELLADGAVTVYESEEYALMHLSGAPGGVTKRLD